MAIIWLPSISGRHLRLRPEGPLFNSRAREGVDRKLQKPMSAEGAA